MFGFISTEVKANPLNPEGVAKRNGQTTRVVVRILLGRGG